MLRPWPSGSACATISVDTGGSVRCARLTMANVKTIAATPSAIAMRTIRRPALEVRSKRSGRRRRTSTNSTVESVSMATWVRARSGAPCTTKSPAIA